MVHELKIIRHLLENNFFCKIRRKKTNVLGLLTRQWLREKIHSGFNRLSRQWCSFSFFHEGAQIFFFLLADWILILSGRSGPADQKNPILRFSFSFFVCSGVGSWRPRPSASPWSSGPSPSRPRRLRSFRWSSPPTCCSRLKKHRIEHD